MDVQNTPTVPTLTVVTPVPVVMGSLGMVSPVHVSIYTQYSGLSLTRPALNCGHAFNQSLWGCV